MAVNMIALKTPEFLWLTQVVLSMKPVNFDYERPRTIDEACELLASNSNARILAGGQSLIPMLSMRLSRPSLLIDIAHIKDLSEIVATDTHIEIGAMVRQAVAKNAIMIQEYIPTSLKSASPCWSSADAGTWHCWRLDCPRRSVC